MATEDTRIELEEAVYVDYPNIACPHTSSSSSNSNTHAQHQAQTKSLEEVLVQLSKTSIDTDRCWSIFKVPYLIRQVNEKAYEPKLISIGPYHHGKEHLKKMEIIKKNCLSRIIGERKDRAKKLVGAMKDMEEDVRKCYPEALDHIDSDAFVKMMILDGCFIVYLFQNENPSKHFLGLIGVRTEIYHDLLLLENQLPFSVLSKLNGMINNEPDIERLDMLFAENALRRLSRVVPGPKLNIPKEFSGNIKHLLGLVHDCWIPHPPPTRVQGQGSFSKFLPCATELDEAGIIFVKKDIEVGNDEDGLYDIEFTDAKLKIPVLSIYTSTDRIFRNLIAYEQFNPLEEPTYVCDYAKFMDNLIDSGKDVQLLCNSGVIVNWLGDDEAVAQMFNKLCNFAYLSGDTFYYKKIYDDVNEHCQKRRNVWKAKLKKDYFNYPWSLISVIAAAVLLLLTMVQTIFSVLSYSHPQ